MKGAQSFVCCLSWHAEDSQIENGLWLGWFVKQKGGCPMMRLTRKTTTLQPSCMTDYAINSMWS